MAYTTFITVEEAGKCIDKHNCLFVDCSYSNPDPHFGLNEYDKGHIPNSVYLDLNNDLSGPVIPNVSGRHPLPSEAEIVSLFSKIGIDATVEVIIYDSSAGDIAAARLWWLLNWAGHNNASVIIGGKNAWTNAGLPLENKTTVTVPKRFAAIFRNEYIATVDEVVNYTTTTDSEKYCLIDSRTNDRFHGINEHLDHIGGHIPTAISKPFNQCIMSNGTIAEKEIIADYFKDEISRQNVIFYCGSGVTACFNVLLFVYVCDKFPRLYPGSWSEWIQSPERKIERE